MKFESALVVAAVFTLGLPGAARAGEEAKAPAAKLEDAKASEAKAPEARDIFVKYRCRSCHSIQAVGVVRKKSADPEDSKDSKTKKEPPDLSGIGLEKKSDWIVKFLTRKETLEGDRHPKKFTGPDADLATLAKWLETMKVNPKKGAKAEKGEKPGEGDKGAEGK